MCPGDSDAAFGPERLGRDLAPLLGEATSLVVALSGGADSAALLAAALALARAEPRLCVRALHVDHGFPAAAPLAAAAAALAARLGVPLEVRRVAVDLAGGGSVEALARDARRAAFAAALRPGECLLTAHHREDQAETLLLQLLRGAGLPGLAAMPASAPLGAGRQLRPLLGVPREALRAYAAALRLPWHEDPMNAEPRYDRAYLRAAVWPRVAARWPAAAATLARSAAHLAAAQRLLDEASARALAAVPPGAPLAVTFLAGLDPERRAEVVRYWLRREGLPAPPARRLARLERELLGARADGAPRIEWPGAELRRFQGAVYAFAPLPALPLADGARLAAAPATFALGPLGRLEVAVGEGEAAIAAPAAGAFELRRRAGGERLRRAAGGASRPLKDWLREGRVPPWTRERAILVYADGVLAAAVLPQGTIVAAEARARPGTPGLTIRWTAAPAALLAPAFIEAGRAFG